MASSSAAPAPKDADASSNAVSTGKGRATPTRAEREAARQRPLVPDKKEARAKARAELAARRERERVGMAAGDERYLPVRDRGPQRRWVRDHVDAGWHLGEAVMPFMLVVVLLTFVSNAFIQNWSFVALILFMVFVIADMIITSIRVKRLASKRWGERRERGLGLYAAMRTIQMRFMRMPKPQVKRGQKPA